MSLAVPTKSSRREVWRSPVVAVLALVVVIFALIFVVNPTFAAPAPLLALLKKSAPLLILAAGQYFVIVAGELDLSVGALVGAQVVIAARLIDGEDSRVPGVLLLMVAFGVLVGVVNGLVTTVLRVPSIITTLGSLLVLTGAVRFWTGGSPTGSLPDSFRVAGRQGLDVAGVEIPWAVLIVVGIGIGVVTLMRTAFGRVLVAVGDSDTVARFSGVRVAAVRTAAFVLSSVLATVAAVLLGGYAGVTSQVGEGLEFVAITAVVLGGVALGGGVGSPVAAMLGALALDGLYTLFNQWGLPPTMRPAVQGVIIIVAVALAAGPATAALSRLRRPRISAPALTADPVPDGTQPTLQASGRRVPDQMKGQGEPWDEPGS